MFSTQSLCLIVDGMDQNTTMVPKLHQLVKGIESQYVKIHLCDVLIHDVGLYIDIWIDTHHKHDKNQVITSIMHVLQDVCNLRGNILPPKLRIQTDNCGRENKNQYMFALCAALLAFKYFAEVYLSFPIMRHTHEDIDQKFTTISRTLKSRDIDSLKELLELVRKGASHIEVFATSRHLEYVWDWKSFITPYLWSGLDAIIGISKPHHFRFYLKNDMPYVQKKDYGHDAMWQPENGHQYLQSFPEQGTKLGIAIVKTTDVRELKSLESFIQMKGRCISKRMYVQKNLDAIEEARWLANYLIHFPTAYKSEAAHCPFWPKGNLLPNEKVNKDKITIDFVESFTNGASSSSREATDLLRNLPPLECREYFGLRRQKLRDNSSRPTKKQRTTPMELCTIKEAVNENPFPEFDPLTDVQVGYFVAINTSIEDREASIRFFLEKVIKLRGHSIKIKNMMVT